MNLWWPADIAEWITGCSFEGDPREIDALMFVGNVILVVGILVCIFAVHLVVVSGVEAYWLAKVKYATPALYSR